MHGRYIWVLLTTLKRWKKKIRTRSIIFADRIRHIYLSLASAKLCIYVRYFFGIQNNVDFLCMLPHNIAKVFFMEADVNRWK